MRADETGYVDLTRFSRRLFAVAVAILVGGLFLDSRRSVSPDDLRRQVVVQSASAHSDEPTDVILIEKVEGYSNLVEMIATKNGESVRYRFTRKPLRLQAYFVDHNGLWQLTVVDEHVQQEFDQVVDRTMHQH
jgi:hypothetical protein